jgi:hypothetical protein
MGKRVFAAFLALALLAGSASAPGELAVTRTSRLVRLLRG